MEIFNAEIKFSEEQLLKVKEIISRYPEGKQKSALLPLLHLAQHDFEGWLSVPLMDHIAQLLDIKPIEVYEVATFYSMYNLQKVGKCMIEFCHTGPCLLNGVEEIISYTEDKLGIKTGQTTVDGKFTIKTVECLGACGYAPMAQVGEYYYEHLTQEKIDKMVEVFVKEDFNSDLKYNI